MQQKSLLDIWGVGKIAAAIFPYINFDAFVKKAEKLGFVITTQER